MWKERVFELKLSDAGLVGIFPSDPFLVKLPTDSCAFSVISFNILLLPMIF